MDWRNRIGLYGSYFLAMSGIGFTLPYLPLYLYQEGLADSTIGLVSALAALTSLAQFPIGVWSDRIGRRKPFLLVAVAALAASTMLLHGAHGAIWLGFLVVLFAENGICRATVESLSGAAATSLARPSEVGAALGALRFWKPISIVLVALAGSVLAEQYGVGTVLIPLAVLQTLAVAAVLLLHEKAAPVPGPEHHSRPGPGERVRSGHVLRDATLWVFFTAMVLFHVANAPAGVYLGLFMKFDLAAQPRDLSYAFVVSMVAWILLVRPLGRWADRLGRRPLLIAGWTVMALRLGLLAIATQPAHVLAIQVLDGVANGAFAVLAAAWVTDRFADPRRAGEAQVLVGTALVLGSAVGPVLAGLLVNDLTYHGLFALLAGVGALATALVVLFIPETVQSVSGVRSEPMPIPSKFSTTP